MRTPITYYGGKQNLSERIVSMMPRHKIYCVSVSVGFQQGDLRVLSGNLIHHPSLIAGNRPVFGCDYLNRTAISSVPYVATTTQKIPGVQSQERSDTCGSSHGVVITLALPGDTVLLTIHSFNSHNLDFLMIMSGYPGHHKNPEKSIPWEISCS